MPSQAAHTVLTHCDGKKWQACRLLFLSTAVLVWRSHQPSTLPHVQHACVLAGGRIGNIVVARSSSGHMSRLGEAGDTEKRGICSICFDPARTWFIARGGLDGRTASPAKYTVCRALPARLDGTSCPAPQHDAGRLYDQQPLAPAQYLDANRKQCQRRNRLLPHHRCFSATRPGTA